VSAADSRGFYDVVIVGAGPAGLAAAALTAGAGLSTLVLDENPGPGGQIYRAITTTPVKDRRILGDDYWHGSELVEAAERSGAEIATGALVWSLDRTLELGVSRGGIAGMIRARRVILATGALERPFPIAGWTLPGVMTGGAAQTLLKASGLVPEGRTVIAGMGPLLWLLAAQLLRAGARIDAILETTPRLGYLRALPHAPGLLLSPLLAKGLGLMREVRARVHAIRGVTHLEAEGDSKVRAVRFARRNGAMQRLGVDQLLLHQGVVPNVNLAMSCGVAHRWDPLQLCWSPVLDTYGGTSVDGIAIAGDGAGIAGAWAAAERGRLAAIAAVRALAPSTAVIAEQSVRQALRRHEAGRRFLDTLYQPPRQFRVPDGDILACRCEEVTARQIRETAALGCEGPNQMKAFLRCGMGPCQGRLCGLTVTELIADARQTTPEAVGYYRLRPPVKPIPLAELAQLPAGDSAASAVVRG
jgi:NADPH-dependent 2,4-dienoyl-CoA reductase/sulfur reductase-like enzyme